MAPRSRIALLLPAALAVLASGCGWLAASPQVMPTAPRLSHSELTSRANAICARRTRALAQLERPSSEAHSRRFFARVAAIERAEAAALAGLRPPQAQEREFLRLVTASVELAQTAARFHRALVDGKGHDRRRALADADRLSAAYDRAARRIGLACRQAA